MRCQRCSTQMLKACHYNAVKIKAVASRSVQHARIHARPKNKYRTGTLRWAAAESAPEDLVIFKNTPSEIICQLCWQNNRRWHSRQESAQQWNRGKRARRNMLHVLDAPRALHECRLFGRMSVCVSAMSYTHTDVMCFCARARGKPFQTEKCKLCST